MTLLPEISFSHDSRKPIKCPHCKWTGELRECREERYISPPESWMVLAGRDGWQYFCPRCKWLVHEEWMRMS